MTKRFILFLSGIFSLLNLCHAQERGILPLTGARYFKEGINAKAIEIKTDAGFLLTNRVPLNKQIEIWLQSPTGFSEDKTKSTFPAAELIITSLNGTVLSKVPNLFAANEAKGFQGTNNQLVIKAPITAAILKAEPGCMIKVRFYDLKGKNQLRIELVINISKPGEALQVSKTITDAKIAVPAASALVGIKMKNILVTTDTTIRVNPKMAYASLDMSGIDGTTLSEVLGGKESYWVYDSDLNEVKMTDKQLKQVKGAMEDNQVDYLSKLPFRLKALAGKTFFVRFRWESSDKRKLIDVVVTR